MLGGNVRKNQSGVMLLEALIAILIFSMGVLGLVGMQAAAVNASRDAKYRADAGLLANQLIGQMWASKRDGAALQNNFSSTGSSPNAYSAWATRVAATLPVPAAPTVVVTQGAPVTPNTPPTSSKVTITVNWQAPGGPVSNYKVVVQVI